MNWNELRFDFNPTGGENVRYYYRNGEWSAPQFTTDETIPVHISSAALNYGISAFEGLKVFRTEEGKIHIFRPLENAHRMQEASRRLCMPEVSDEMFLEACCEVVRRNAEFIPPLGTAAEMYLRPVLFATKPCLTVRAVDEAAFVVFATPVGTYFKEGIHPIKVVIDRSQDRVAPRGTGDVKIAANYAPSILTCERAHRSGYGAVIYTDALTHRYVEECGAANFIALRGNQYITPDSHTVLPSITNNSLCQLAADMGMEVIRRPIAIDELAEFDTVAACGTGAIISPIGTIFDLDTGEKVSYGDEVSPRLLELYHRLLDIQHGRAEDKHGWLYEVK